MPCLYFTSCCSKFVMPTRQDLSYGVEIEFLHPSSYVRADVEALVRGTNWR